VLGLNLGAARGRVNQEDRTNVDYWCGGKSSTVLEPTPLTKTVTVDTLVLTARDVARSLDLSRCIEAVEQALGLHEAGHACGPASTGLTLPDGSFHVKTAGLSVDGRSFIAVARPPAAPRRNNGASGAMSCRHVSRARCHQIMTTSAAGHVVATVLARTCTEYRPAFGRSRAEATGGRSERGWSWAEE